MIDKLKLEPILKKESILKTANARELRQAPQDVLERYTGYALTHAPLGDTVLQLANLRRVIVENKTCAIGTIVGPYGYGKTSTAVHLWSELRNQRILAVPPFEWLNLNELLDAVYWWIRFEFDHGPKGYVEPLERLYHSYRQRYMEELSSQIQADVLQDLLERGRLVLDIRAEDIVGFYQDACQLCEQAGYMGLAVFTDELQATLAHYKPSRDQFFADLFEIVKGTLGLPGHWAFVLTMDNDTEGYIARLRADVLQRLQKSALYFRVSDVYNRREYPAELWSAFQERFAFDGSAVIQSETLDAIGQVAARADLGAGPRMVTNALSLAVRSFMRTSSPYTPLQFVDDFLDGQMLFDQRGKFVTSVRKALDNPEVSPSDVHQRVIKLLAAYPMGCSEEALQRFELLGAFRNLPPLARRELILQQSGGYILRYLAEKEEEPEQIEQRLIKEFVSRYAPGKTYAERAISGFLTQVLLDPLFAGWKRERHNQVRIGDVEYQGEFMRGTFDARYPERLIAVLVAAMPQSVSPQWMQPVGDADLELRFELNYGLAQSEPSRLLVSPSRPNVAVFQLNLTAFDATSAERMLRALREYYDAEQLTPLLALALIEHLHRNGGDRPDDRSRVNMVIAPLRQYGLSVLLGEALQAESSDYKSTMVGTERIKDLFRQQCRVLYPNYQTLIASRNWRENLQQYTYAIEKAITDDGLSVARGRRPWKATKEEVADAFRIPGRRLVNLQPLLDALDQLIVKEEFSGRQSVSEVTLRFRMHPLEQDWLLQLDASREKAQHNGVDVAALPVEQLVRKPKHIGYTDAEIQEVTRLLQARRFIDFEPKKAMIVRTVDAIDDLRDAVTEQLNNLEQYIHELKALPDFEAGRYPVVRLRSTLESARERDEVETVRAEVRRYDSDLRAFAAQRLATVREKVQQEQSNLLEFVRAGVPAWLGREFSDSPIAGLLEKQRRDLAAAYDATLSEVRQALDKSAADIQQVETHGPQAVVKISQILIDLSKQGRRLRTRLQSYEDHREDLEAWRRVSDTAVELNAWAKRSEQVYGNAELRTDVDKLWATLRAKFEAQPLAVLGMHRDTAAQIEGQRRRIAKWIEGRRDEFDKQREKYQVMLSSAGIEADLRIPFDAEQPSNSYVALHASIREHLQAHIAELGRRLNYLLQVVRYGIQVQRLPLSDCEAKIRESLKHAGEVNALLAAEGGDQLAQLEKIAVEHVAALTTSEHELSAGVHQAVQPRAAEGTETRLMQLLSERVSGQPVDLRSLIMHLLDAGVEEVDITAIMRDLQSLFQKNQIELRIGLLKTRAG